MSTSVFSTKDRNQTSEREESEPTMKSWKVLTNVFPLFWTIESINKVSLLAIQFKNEKKNTFMKDVNNNDAT
jgi:hypothetical protein